MLVFSDNLSLGNILYPSKSKAAYPPKRKQYPSTSSYWLSVKYSQTRVINPINALYYKD